jgi:chromosome segregation ATPase
MSMPAAPVTIRRLADSELQVIVGNLARPLSPEYALNRYPQDVQALVGEVLALRRERAEVVRALQRLPLEDVTLADGPLEIVAKAEAMWLDYQRGLWAERETGRLKKTADRAEAAVQSGKHREERLQERIASLEADSVEQQQLAASLTAQVRELTENLAAATRRESDHAERVRMLEADRGELERIHALELASTRGQQDASERDWHQRAEALGKLLEQARALLLVRAPDVPAAATPRGKEVQNGQPVAAA